MNANEFAKYILTKPKNTIVNFSFSEDLDGKYGCGIHDLYNGDIFTIGYWGGCGGIEACDLSFDYDRNDEDELVKLVEETVHSFMNYHGQHKVFLDTEDEPEYAIEVKYNKSA